MAAVITILIKHMKLTIPQINISLFLCLFSVAALLMAYISQYVFGMEPCIFCLYQRIPYFIVITLSALSLFIHGQIRLFLIFLCAVALLAGGAIAFYHVGIEQGVFELSSGCGVGEAVPSTLEEMTSQIMGKPNVACDKPQFVFAGVSIAGWNFLFSSALGFITMMIAIRTWRK